MDSCQIKHESTSGASGWPYVVNISGAPLTSDRSSPKRSKADALPVGPAWAAFSTWVLVSLASAAAAMGANAASTWARMAFATSSGLIWICPRLSARVCTWARRDLASAWDAWADVSRRTFRRLMICPSSRLDCCRPWMLAALAVEKSAWVERLPRALPRSTRSCWTALPVLFKSALMSATQVFEGAAAWEVGAGLPTVVVMVGAGMEACA